VTSPTDSPSVSLVPRPLDPDSREWLASLRAEGAVRDAACARLHSLLLRAARFELRRRRAAVYFLDRGDLEDLAQQAADDAFVAVLARLDTFRGASRFTTWAYKFALLEAAVKVRRLAWRHREIPLETDAWPALSGGFSPEGAAEQHELLGLVREGIETALTPHQRRVLVALVLNEVPIDVLAERLGTTRGALYKTLHDARRKLRAELENRGLPREASPGRRQ
jgi:RNA polymerase sigma-70 factor (ECF subfamily)